MTGAWHIAWKDLRLQRWTLVAWLFVSIVSISNRVFAPLVQNDPAWRMAVPLWIAVVVFGYFPIWIACIANTIHADRLVGSTAFWLTRPIGPGTLLGAKLLGLGAFVLLPSLILEAILMAAFRVSPGVILAALLQQAWMLSLLTLVIVFLSAVTTTVIRVLIVIAVAGTSELVWIQIRTAMIRRQLAAAGTPVAYVGVSLPFAYMDPNAMVLGVTFFAIGVLIAIAYQYRFRRRGPAIALFAAACVATWMLQGAWAYVPLIGEPSVDHEPWAREAKARLRTVDAVSGRPLAAATGIVPLGARHSVIAAPVMLDGLPAGYIATPILQRAELTLDQGGRVDTLANDAADREITIDSHVERWATLLDVDNQALRQHGDSPATYAGVFDFVIQRSTPIGTLPATVGASVSDGVRSVTVVGTRFETSGCTLRLQTTAVTLVTHALEWPDLVLRYQYRDGREMVDPYAPPRNNQRVFLMPRYAAGTPSLLRAFDLNVRTAYPMLRDEARSHPSDAVHAACSDITISVARVSYAGRLTRMLELHDFHLNDPFSTR